MKGNFYITIEEVEEQKNFLLNAWMNRKKQNFKKAIQLTIQSIEEKKNQNPELNISTQYQLGKLDGYTEILEQLYYEEQKARFIANENNHQIYNILKYLYKNGRTRHDKLEKDVGCDYNSLISIMKRLLHSGMIEYSSFCRYTYYRLTESGRWYCNCYLFEG